LERALLDAFGPTAIAPKPRVRRTPAERELADAERAHERLLKRLVAMYSNGDRPSRARLTTMNARLAWSSERCTAYRRLVQAQRLSAGAT
jgi:hypothetical protein